MEARRSRSISIFSSLDSASASMALHSATPTSTPSPEPPRVGLRLSLLDSLELGFGSLHFGTQLTSDRHLLQPLQVVALVLSFCPICSCLEWTYLMLFFLQVRCYQGC